MISLFNNSSGFRRIVFALSGLLAAWFYIIASPLPRDNLRFSFSGWPDAKISISVDRGNGYLPENTLTLLPSSGPVNKNYQLGIDDRNLRGMRINFNSGMGRAELSRIGISTRYGEFSLDCGQLQMSPGMAVATKAVAGGCAYQVAGHDPHLEIRYPRYAFSWSFLLLLLPYAAGFGVLVFLALLVASEYPIDLSRSENLANERAIRLFYALLAVGAIGFIWLDLNVSSLGLWTNITGAIADNSRILGSARAIRSDEWLVQTPMYLSQLHKRIWGH